LPGEGSFLDDVLDDSTTHRRPVGVLGKIVDSLVDNSFVDSSEEGL